MKTNTKRKRSGETELLEKSEKKDKKVYEKKSKKIIEPVDEEIEEEEMVENEIPISKGVNAFKTAFSKIMQRDIIPKNPILSRRITSSSKQALVEKQKLKEAKMKYSEKKVLRKAHLTLPDAFSQDYERTLRKVATKGVIALFNAISQHQYRASMIIKEEEESKKQDTTKKEVDNSKSNNFMQVLKKSTESIAKNDNNGNSGNNKWAVLDDNYARKQVSRKKIENDNDEEEDNFLLDV